MGSRSERALGAASSGSRGREVAGHRAAGAGDLRRAQRGLAAGRRRPPDGAVRRHRRARRLRAGRRRRLSGRRSASASRRCAACKASRCASSRSASGPRSASACRRHPLAPGARHASAARPPPGRRARRIWRRAAGRVRRPRRRRARRRGAARRVAGAVDVAVVPRLPSLLAQAGRGVLALGKGALGVVTRSIALIFPAHDDEDDDGRRRARAGRRREAGEEAARQEGRGRRHRRRRRRRGRRGRHPRRREGARRHGADEAQGAQARRRAAGDQAGGRWPRRRKRARPARSSTTSAPRSAPRAAPIPDELGPKIVEPLAIKKKELAQKAPEAPKPDFIPAAGGYHLPDTSLLDYEESHEDKIDKSAMLALADKLQKTLADYGVKGDVVEIHPGPVVTMYEFVPAPGTKLSKISALSNDLAMALEALRVRIVAPIPGKGSVGIEVPNKIARDGVPEGDPRRRGRAEGQVEADDGARQGHRRRAGRGRPGEDAAPARRRHHRLGQVGGGQRDDLLDPVQLRRPKKSA